MRHPFFIFARAIATGVTAAMIALASLAQSPPATPASSTGGTKVEASCKGKFTNPITDVCWRCVFPLRVAGFKLPSIGKQEDNNNTPSSGVCACDNAAGVPIPGLTLSFWEPIRTFEATRRPYCFVSLGGLTLDLPFHAGGHAHPNVYDKRDGRSLAVYNQHWIINPLLYLLEVIKDDGCQEKQQFDIAYIGELDPLANNDFAAFVLNPDVILYANPVAVASCSLDCMQASLGFGRSDLYWCGGCQGSMFPLTRNVGAYIGGVQTSALLMQRTALRLHREGLMYDAASGKAMCGYQYQPIMDKTNYKYSMVYPQHQGVDNETRCCQPFGRSTILMGAGKEVPYFGEDFAYLIFRKRSCCSSNLLQQAVSAGAGQGGQ